MNHPRIHHIGRRTLASIIALAALILPWTHPSESFGAPPPAPDALTEASAFQWGAAAQQGAASVEDDVNRVRVGTSSLRYVTGGGFDSWMWSPLAKNAAWDLTGTGGVRFWVYAQNTNSPTFQNLSPWIRLHSSPNSYIELHSTSEVLVGALGQWIQLSVPFGGNSEWTRTVVGTPNLASINYLEIHADTWGYGFALWIDGLSFDLPFQPPQSLHAFAGNGTVTLDWQPVPTASSIRVYRSSSPIASVVGLTPIAVVASSSGGYIDTSVVNGQRYHYAVTAAYTAAETAPSSSVGPRTPRSEADLQIATISRTPRYPRFNVIYQNYTVTEPGGFGPYSFPVATGLGGGQTPATKHTPAVGESITYTAKIRNRGTTAWNGAIPVTWRFGAETVQSTVSNSSLAPGGTLTTSLVRGWPAVPVEVSCTLGITDARPSNNARSITSDSVAFLSFFDRTYEENFRELSTAYPNAATDDFIDWVNRHMDRLNALFAAANCGKRVHYDVLERVADGSADPAVNQIDFAIFPFRFYQSEQSFRVVSGFYRPNEDIDYGYLHEMGHQLGLVDLYRIDLPAANNQVTGTGYLAGGCLMHSADDYISANSAGAMNLWRDKAHGYFGQYLYRLPSQIGVRIIGANRQPLANASVRIFQKQDRPGLGEVLTNQVKFTGTTGADGTFMLPNVGLDSSLVPPAYTGDSIQPNPFGYVSCLGTNGLFLIAVDFMGFTDYAWLDIVECNNAWHAGLTLQAIFDKHVALGGDIQNYPPADMTEMNASDWGWYAADGTVVLSDEVAIRTEGVASLKAVATGGFDTALVYPRSGGIVASWNLTTATEIQARFRAFNSNNNGFQEGPWFRLRCANGWYDYRCCTELNSALGQWISVAVPLAGSANWIRTSSGSPSLADVRALEIHSDTWGYGYTLWADGVRFFPTPVPPRPGDLDGSGTVNGADLAILLSNWGTSGVADLDGDGVVAGPDLAILLGNWG